MQQVRDSPGGIEEWSKDDVLEIVVENFADIKDTNKSRGNSEKLKLLLP